MNVRTLGLVAGLVWGGTALAQGEEEQGQKKGEYKVEGTVVDTDEKNVLLRQDNGAIISLEVNDETLVDGERIKDEDLIESRLEKEFSEGEEVRASFETKERENVATSLEQASKEKKY